MKENTYYNTHIYIYYAKWLIIKRDTKRNEKPIILMFVGVCIRSKK